MTRSPAWRVFLACLSAFAVGSFVVGLQQGIASFRNEANQFSVLTHAIGLVNVAAIPLAIGCGLVLAAAHRLWGRNWMWQAHKTLLDDRARDGHWASIVVAGLIGLLVSERVIRILATSATQAERKPQAAALVGISVLPMVVVGLAVATVFFWAIRRPLASAPRPPLITKTLLVLAIGLALWALRAYGAVTGGFKVDALPTKAYLPIVVLVALGLSLYLVYEQVTARVAGAKVVALSGSIIALLLLAPMTSLLTPPPQQTKEAITGQISLPNLMVGALRKRIDSDGDNVSPFFLGPDCDDSNKSIYGGKNKHGPAADIPGNGIDEDCFGGDAKALGKVAPIVKPITSSGGKLAENVIVVMIDTVRADRLGAAGYKRAGESMTPNLDALAKQSAYFTNAYAQGARTPQSTPSILTGRFTSRIAQDKSKSTSYPTLEDSNTTVFEVAQAAGLKTLHFSSHFYFLDQRNLNQGFDVFDNTGALNVKESNYDIASPRIIPRVNKELANLAKSNERFAMFVHLFEPHSTYVKHEEFPLSGKGSGMDKLSEKYDYELAFVDMWLGKLFESLKATGLQDNTMVVILSDHGESFGDRPMKHKTHHGTHLYEEVIKVPLIIRIPGQKPRQIDQKVMLVDVAPTIVDALALSPVNKDKSSDSAKPKTGISDSSAAGASSKQASNKESKVPELTDIDGISLVPAIKGKDLPPRVVFAELTPYGRWETDAYIVIDKQGKFKLHYLPMDNKIMLFNLETDPKEKTNLANKDKATKEKLEQIMSQLKQRLQQ